MGFILVDMWILGVLQGGFSFRGIRVARVGYIPLATMWWSDVACAISKPFYSPSLFCVLIHTSVFSLAAWTKLLFDVWLVEEDIPFCLDQQDRHCLCLLASMSFFDMRSSITKG